MNGQIFYTEDGFPVDTLILKSFPKDMRDDNLFNYFSTFGSVQSLRTHIHATDSSGFVQFQEAEVTAKVLRIKHHTIDGHRVRVEIARTGNQDVSSTAKDDLPLESTNLTGIKLMDLHDDCLREILAHATPMTLCSLLELSETCKNNRLKAMTIETFTRKNKICQLNECAPTVDEAHRLLANFGPLISNLVAAEYYGEDKTIFHAVKSIGQFCSGTVTSLCLLSYTFEKTDAKALKVLFGSLEKLALYFCHFECGAADLFAHCESLVEVDVSDYGLMGHGDETVNEALFQHTFPNLEVFYGNTKSRRFKKFIARHKKLKTISLSYSQDYSDLLPIIADNCSELKILTICTGILSSYPVKQGNFHYYPITYKMPVTRIASLKHLEVLQISYVENPLECVQQLRHLESLKELIFQGKCGSPQFMSALSQLKTLERLHFLCSDKFVNFTPLAQMGRLKDLLISSGGNAAELDLIYMVSRLTNLEKFHIYLYPDFEIDDKMYAKLVHTRSELIGPRRKLEFSVNKKLFNI